MRLRGNSSEGIPQPATTHFAFRWKHRRLRSDDLVLQPLVVLLMMELLMEHADLRMEVFNDHWLVTVHPVSDTGHRQ